MADEPTLDNLNDIAKKATAKHIELLAAYESAKTSLEELEEGSPAAEVAKVALTGWSAALETQRSLIALSVMLSVVASRLEMQWMFNGPGLPLSDVVAKRSE